MACKFKSALFCPMGDAWPCRQADCPPIKSQSKTGRYEVFSQEFVDELKKGEKKPSKFDALTKERTIEVKIGDKKEK